MLPFFLSTFVLFFVQNVVNVGRDFSKAILLINVDLGWKGEIETDSNESTKM